MDNNKKRHQPTFACVGIGDLEVEVDLLDELALLGDELLELGEAEAHAVERDLVIFVVVHRLEVDVGHGGRTTCLSPSLSLRPSIATEFEVALSTSCYSSNCIQFVYFLCCWQL